MGITEILKLVMDVFGAAIIVPIVVFILSLCLKVEVKKALRGAIFMGIGLTAFNIILGVLVGSIAPLITEMVNNTGINLPIIDIGWPAGAAIVYANQLGMIYLVLGVGFNLVLFQTKVTDTFEPTDIWNFYYFVIWAMLVQFVTGSFAFAVFAAMFMNMILLFFADWLAPSLQEYYGYEGVTSTCFAVINIAVLAVLVRWIIVRFKIREVQLSPQTIQEKFGFWGEPAIIGLILGTLIAFLAKLGVLGQLQTWQVIISTALTLAAVLVLYPAISGWVTVHIRKFSTPQRFAVWVNGVPQIKAIS
jgi:PTS system galactitol-specific IIC component